MADWVLGLEATRTYAALGIIASCVGDLENLWKAKPDEVDGGNVLPINTMRHSYAEKHRPEMEELRNIRNMLFHGILHVAEDGNVVGAWKPRGTNELVSIAYTPNEVVELALRFKNLCPQLRVFGGPGFTFVDELFVCQDCQASVCTLEETHVHQRYHARLEGLL